MSSKILLTTQKTEVALRLGLESNLLQEPKLLNDKQSWGLHEKKTCITRYRGTGKFSSLFSIVSYVTRSLVLVIQYWVVIPNFIACEIISRVCIVLM